MKKRAMAIIALLLCSTVYQADNVLAINDSDVRYTVHNLAYIPNGSPGIKNSERNYKASNPDATEVCVFCHTPHNASPSVPLWNKAYDPSTAGTYRLYTSSSTLSNTVKKHSSIDADSPSMLCLSCHDGKTAINVLHNTRVSDAPTSDGLNSTIFVGNFSQDGQAFGDQWIGPQSVYPSNLGAVRDSTGRIATQADGLDGTNLTDDHPIGFSYQNAVGEKPNDLHSLADAKANKLRFFGPNKDRLECSSCHNPHIYYGYGRAGSGRVRMTTPATPEQLARTPFLVRDNNGSALCLGCHIK